MQLEGRVVVITGSADNIGKAAALRFAGEGARVVVHSKTNLAGGEATARQIRQSGGQAIHVQADVSVPDQVRRLFEAAVGAFGTVDILINNAGRAKACPFLEITREHLIDQFDSNFFGTVLCCREAVPIMQENRGGRIINAASIRGIEHTGREGIMAYSAAKAAVINFTKTLAKELAPAITVNAVAPGFVDTTAYQGMSEELKESFIRSSLIGRWIRVEEIAEAFLYLARADAITGEVLVVDGGSTLK